MVDTSLDRLEAIERVARSTQRGVELERFVADVFREQHFTVRLNAGVARPRQTDVLASRAAEVYLIECKWRSDKANIDDIDSLRSRLRRTDGRAVGLLVSVPGFSGSVLHDVEHHREQPILLISSDELRLVASRGEALSSLLWRKKEALSADGTVLLDEPPRKRTSKHRIALPAADGWFVLADGTQSTVVDCAGAFGRFVFADKLPDIDWVPAAGLGVTLDLAPRVHDERELLDLVGRLAGLGWATPDARSSIQQATRNWHGLGCAAFADALPQWRRRTDSPESDRSEEICYLDRCDGGFYTLTAKLAAQKGRQTEFVRLSFQLQGIPLDTGPLLELCRSVGAHDGLYFRPRAEESVTRRILREEYRVETRPISYLVTDSYSSDQPIWPPTADRVTGVVIPNPFLGSTDNYLATTDHRAYLEWIHDSEQLICALRLHHPLDGQRRDYRLKLFEYARTSDVMVCRPIVDWRRKGQQRWLETRLNRQAP